MTQMKMMNSLKGILLTVQEQIEEPKFKKLANFYDIGGYKRIYLIHIRKTGGTSLNNMFLSLGQSGSESLYDELVESSSHRLLRKGKIFVGWNARLINKGNYYYAFSHEPFHSINLPDDTFTITCFRDPVKRVVSHYNMLMNYSVNNVPHPCMEIEGKWLGTSFDDFIENIPPEHLLNQLYMFSANFNVEEAFEKIKRVSHCLFTENFQAGVDGLNAKLGLDLKPVHIRKSSYNAAIPEDSIALLREKLDKEYALMTLVKLLNP